MTESPVAYEEPEGVGRVTWACVPEWPLSESQRNERDMTLDA
jgi:hypothetical protein